MRTLGSWRRRIVEAALLLGLILWGGDLAAQDPLDRCRVAYVEPAPSPGKGHLYRILVDPELKDLSPRLVGIIRQAMDSMIRSRSGRYLLEFMTRVSPSPSETGLGDVYLSFSSGKDQGKSYIPSRDIVSIETKYNDPNIAISNPYIQELPAGLFHEMVHKLNVRLTKHGGYNDTLPLGAVTPHEGFIRSEFMDEMLTIGDPFASRYTFPCENMLRDELGLPRKFSHKGFLNGDLFELSNAKIDPDRLEDLRKRFWARSEHAHDMIGHRTNPVPFETVLKHLIEVVSSPERILAEFETLTNRISTNWPEPIRIPIYRRVESILDALLDDPLMRRGPAYRAQANALQDSWNPLLGKKLVDFYNHVQSRLSALIPCFDFAEPARGRMDMSTVCSAFPGDRALHLNRDPRLNTPHDLRMETQDALKWLSFQEWETGQPGSGAAASAQGSASWSQEEAAIPRLAPPWGGPPERPADCLILQLELDSSSHWAAFRQYSRAPDRTLWIQWKADGNQWDQPAGHRTYGADLQITRDTTLLLVAHARGRLENRAASVAEPEPATLGRLAPETMAIRLRTFLGGVYREGSAFSEAPATVRLLPCEGVMGFDAGNEFDDYLGRLSGALCPAP